MSVFFFKTFQIFQSILSGGSQPFSRQMSEMSNAEEDCIDATEQGKGTLHTFTVDIAFTWGGNKRVQGKIKRLYICYRAG